MQSVYGSTQQNSSEKNFDQASKMRHKHRTSPKVPLTPEVKTRNVPMPVKYDKAIVQKVSVHIRQYLSCMVLCMSLYQATSLAVVQNSAELTSFGFAGAASCATTCARNQGSFFATLCVNRIWGHSLLIQLAAHCAVVSKALIMLSSTGSVLPIMMSK